MSKLLNSKLPFRAISFVFLRNSTEIPYFSCESVEITICTRICRIYQDMESTTSLAQECRGSIVGKEARWAKSDSWSFLGVACILNLDYDAKIWWLKTKWKRSRRLLANFRLDILIKKCRVRIWFITYLMQNVYKFSVLSLAMLLVCGRCNFYSVRMDICTRAGWVIIYGDSWKSKILLQSSKILFS